jgi:hypothetical protein
MKYLMFEISKRRTTMSKRVIAIITPKRATPAAACKRRSEPVNSDISMAALAAAIAILNNVVENIGSAMGSFTTFGEGPDWATPQLMRAIREL